jgi:hypothetical protein
LPWVSGDLLAAGALVLAGAVLLIAVAGGELTS